MRTILFDNLHPLAEEYYEKYGYPSSKNTRVAIERELEAEQHMMDQLYEQYFAEISGKEQCRIDFLYEEYLANLKEDNKNDK